MNKSDAINFLTRSGIAAGANFYTLARSQVCDLLAFADLVKYRKPRNANGSRGRYFHEYCQRVARRAV